MINGHDISEPDTILPLKNQTPRCLEESQERDLATISNICARYLREQTGTGSSSSHGCAR